jgi:hypothetical protein
MESPPRRSGRLIALALALAREALNDTGHATRTTAWPPRAESNAPLCSPTLTARIRNVFRMACRRRLRSRWQFWINKSKAAAVRSVDELVPASDS